MIGLMENETIDTNAIRAEFVRGSSKYVVQILLLCDALDECHLRVDNLEADLAVERFVSEVYQQYT